jgi:hypothetical protein
MPSVYLHTKITFLSNQTVTLPLLDSTLGRLSRLSRIAVIRQYKYYYQCDLKEHTSSCDRVHVVYGSLGHHMHYF